MSPSISPHFSLSSLLLQMEARATLGSRAVSLSQTLSVKVPVHSQGKTLVDLIWEALTLLYQSVWQGMKYYDGLTWSCGPIVTQWSRGGSSSKKLGFCYPKKGKMGHKQELSPLVRPLNYEGGQSLLVSGLNATMDANALTNR